MAKIQKYTKKYQKKICVFGFFLLPHPPYTKLWGEIIACPDRSWHGLSEFFFCFKKKYILTQIFFPRTKLILSEILKKKVEKSEKAESWPLKNFNFFEEKVFFGTIGQPYIHSWCIWGKMSFANWWEMQKYVSNPCIPFTTIPYPPLFFDGGQ